MSVFFHCTSQGNADLINKYNFHKGPNGYFGPGIYFAETPYGSVMKARSSEKNAIIAVQLDLGRCKYEDEPHNDWNEDVVKMMGYDSVRTTFRRSGSEVCVYDPSRITFVAFITWDNCEVNFRFVKKIALDFLDFKFLALDYNGLILRQFKIVQNGNQSMKNIDELNWFNRKTYEVKLYRGMALSCRMISFH